jgi:hypothetical protein
MLVSSYSNGFGQSQGAPSLLALIQAAQDRAHSRSGFGGHFGAAISDFAAFQAGSTSATYKSDDGLVFCTKDRANRPQCTLNKAGEAGRAPIRAMQRAADRIIDLIPTNGLAGRQMKGQMPTGDGATTEQVFTVPSNLSSPIGAQSGYDGVVGPSTMQFTVLALTLAGMLKKFPNPGIALAFVSPTRTDIFAKYSTEIADYLNDVADHFPTLLAAFSERGNTPVQTQLDVATIPFVVPQVAEKTKIGPIIVGAAAMLGATTIGALAAGKKKPGFMYEPSPALGRNRRGGKLRPRGW